MAKKIILLLFIVCLKLLSQNEQILTYAEFYPIQSLDSVTCTNPAELRACELLFDSLIEQNFSGEFVLSLAKNMYISPDGLSYTFILHDNLLWSDGVPLTTLDIEFTLRLLTHPETSQYNTLLKQYIEDVECLNPKRLTINLSQAFFNPRTLFTFKVLPKHKIMQASLQYGNVFSQEPVSCGPFQYEGRKADQIILKRNPNYHRRKSILAGIIIQTYHNRTQAMMDFVKGKIMMIPEVMANEAELLEKNTFLEIQNFRGNSVEYIAINHRSNHRYANIFSLAKLRRAMLHGIQREKIWTDAFTYSTNKKSRASVSSILSGPFPNQSWACETNLSPLKYDPSLAKQLLKECLIPIGYQENNQIWMNSKQEPLEFKLAYPQENNNEKICQQISENLKAIGITVILDPKNRKDFLREIHYDFQFDLAYCQYDYDETYHLFPLFDSSQTKPGQSNFSGFVDSKLMELFIELQNSLNPIFIRGLSQKIHRYIYENNPHLFLWQPEKYIVVHKNLKNFKIHPYTFFGIPNLWKISR